jgi:hypothetical protein
MAITAAAHKLARIMTIRHGYNESIFAAEETRNLKRPELRLRRQARQFGLQLILAGLTTVCSSGEMSLPLRES